VLTALAPGSGLTPQAQASLAASRCTVQTQPPPAKQLEPAAPALAPAPRRRACAEDTLSRGLGSR
jgi:hypothetical protein